MNLSHSRRHRNHSQLWPRFKEYHRFLELAPLKRTLDERKEQLHEIRTRSHLSLQLPLTVECPNRRQTTAMARAFSRAVKEEKLPVKSIEWAGLQSAGRKITMASLGRAFHFKNQLQRAVARRNGPPPSPDTEDDNNNNNNNNNESRMVESQTQAFGSSLSPQTPRKRKMCS
ncbi:MAG: hypothetical protein M1815_003097 [Lichina confinis]|nr:MAG: hypothetical protein M1815_003097 [Lichina confinis]